MPEPKIDPLTWPRRWGLTWLVIAALALGIELAFMEWWRPVSDAVGWVLLLIAIVALYRASYWRGYRHGYGRSCAEGRMVRPLTARPGSSGVAVKP